jgi:sporulation protein YlmC with PRC-barrel domain
MKMKRLVPVFATAAAVAALLALGAGGASAQSSMSSPNMGASPHGALSSGPTPNAAGGAPAASATPMKDPLSSEDISQIEGVSVAGSDGGSIGKISTVLMNPSTKRVDRLVVAEGGIFGVGAHDVALPVDAFRWDAQKHDFVIQKTADDLKTMPEWQRPQLAETPTASPSGMGSGISPGAPAGAISAPVAPSSGANAGQAAH